ncbi:hypothetical protein MUA03_09220 [Enterobacteriaceae bacterium H16N7]|nr:hypothetical protein [Dryocola clanedunensis]
MNKSILLLSVFSLTGCVVANMDSSDYNYVPYIQTFQKKETVGHTNINQRKEDLFACGVDKKTNLDDDTWGRGEGKPGESLQQVVTRAEKLEGCMEKKGYIVYGFDQCGPLKAPTGKCN